MNKLHAWPPDPAVSRPHAEGPWVVRDTIYVYDLDWAWVIPAGFECDLASIPRAVRPLMETSDLGLIPPIIHDFLYRSGGVAGPYKYTRKQADRLFLGLMEWCGVAAWRRQMAYRAVRWFGRGAWQG